MHRDLAGHLSLLAVVRVLVLVCTPQPVLHQVCNRQIAACCVTSPPDSRRVPVARPGRPAARRRP